MHGRMSVNELASLTTPPPCILPALLACSQAASGGPARGRLTRRKRETGFEPATACLEGRNSTTELLPRQSGCADSNRGPPGPKPVALPTAPHPVRAYLNYNMLLVICQDSF